MESNESLNFKSNSKGQKYSNFKCKSFHINFAEFYEEENLSLQFEELVDNKNENDYNKDSFITEYISFCENKKNETRPSQIKNCLFQKILLNRIFK